nr:MAG: hypothetical protein DIU70_03920 [Bacillota bacterium]
MLSSQHHSGSGGGQTGHGGHMGHTSAPSAHAPAETGHGPVHCASPGFPLSPSSAGFPPVRSDLGCTCCLTGCVILFQFIQPPPPGSIIGTLTGFNGCSLPLVQSHPTPHGEIPLAAVDRQFATLCGDLVLVHGRTALDVKCVLPAPHPFALQPFSCFAL